MMKQQLLKQLQHLQDVYSNDCGLMIVITDAQGTALTARTESPSFVRPLADYLFPTREQFLFPILKDVSSINRPIVYQGQSGIKMIIAPIKTDGATIAFIWAGVIIEKQNRALIERALDHRKGNKPIREAVALVPDTTDNRKRQMLDKLGQMSDIASTILQQAYALDSYDEHIREIDDFMQGDPSALHPRLLLERLADIMASDFAGYAVCTDERFNIADTVGGPEYARMIGGEFLLGEGFLGQAGLSAATSHWDKIAWDPRLDFFMECGIHPKELVCFPIKVRGRLKAIAFAGVVSDRSFLPRRIRLGSLLASTYAAQLDASMQEETKNRQRVRLSLLFDIAQSMAASEDECAIMHMLVDVSISLVQGTYACVVIKQPGIAAQAYVVSRKLPSDQVETYAKSVVRRYFAAPPQPLSRNPVLAENDWSRYVYEFPLVSGSEVSGVLAVGLDSEEACEQQRPFLTVLAFMGEVFLQRSQRIMPPLKPSQAAPALAGSQAQPFRSASIDNSLTRREKEVLALLMKGLSNLQIAQKLYISAHTVKNHITKIYEKLGVADRTQALAKMYSNDEQQCRA